MNKDNDKVFRRAPANVNLGYFQFFVLVAGFFSVATFGWFANQFFTPSVASSLETPRIAVTNGPGSAFMTKNIIADIARDGGKSVVNIDTKRGVTVPDSAFNFGMPFKDFEYFFGGKSPLGRRPQGDNENGSEPSENGGGRSRSPGKMQAFGTGSGVIIRSDGYVLTNNHVIQKADDIQVTLSDGRHLTGKVVGRDSFTDLALVKIEAKDLPVVKLGKSDKVQPGDWAIAIGNPLGLDHTVTFGIISALGRSLNSIGSNVELIQTDAAINPGNSGGPLLNIDGELIGLNTAIRGDAQNIGFAIPVDVASSVVDQLLKNGKIDRPYLGIYMQDMSTDLAKSLGMPADFKGVVVAKISPDGPAAGSGLQPGDVIAKINGKQVTDGKQVQTIVRDHKPGDKLSMLLNRNGSLIASELKIGDYPVDTKEN